MVKATLMIALLYFVSPIAIAKIQANKMNAEVQRQEFFQPRVAKTQDFAKSVEAKAVETKLVAVTAEVQTLCAGIAPASVSDLAFCAGHVAEPVMTLTSLESSGMYACEQMVQPELTFGTAIVLGQRNETSEPANQCYASDVEMTDISKLVSQMTTAMN